MLLLKTRMSDEFDPVCPQCASAKLIINLHGLPNFSWVEEMQAKGYQVEMHGCCIGPGDLDAGRYECKACGHKFDLVDEDDED